MCDVVLPVSAYRTSKKYGIMRYVFWRNYALERLDNTIK